MLRGAGGDQHVRLPRAKPRTISAGGKDCCAEFTLSQAEGLAKTIAGELKFPIQNPQQWLSQPVCGKFNPNPFRKVGYGANCIAEEGNNR